jgi:hypothetical protein
MSSTVSFPYPCSNIPASQYGVYISLLTQYERACSTYDQFYIDAASDRQVDVTWFLEIHLQVSFRKFYIYNDLFSQ